MQRLRIRFYRGEAVKFISHLDIMRFWLRALNRAGMPLAYSEGYNPHPRLSLAAPLALGVTSEAELLDIILVKFISPHNFKAVLDRQMPDGIEIRQVNNIAVTMPSLQSQVRFAEYRVLPRDKVPAQDIAAAIMRLLELETLPWEHQRDTGPRRYDLRALVEDIWPEDDIEPGSVGMRLRCDSQGSGRPEQVAAALGFEGYPKSIHRTRLILGTG